MLRFRVFFFIILIFDWGLLIPNKWYTIERAIYISSHDVTFFNSPVYDGRNNLLILKVIKRHTTVRESLTIFKINI